MTIRNQDVLTAACLQVGEDLHPKLRAFGLLDPEAQNIPRAIRQYRERQIHGPCVLPGQQHLALLILFTSRPGDVIPKDVP